MPSCTLITKRDYSMADKIFNLYIIVDTIGQIWFKAKEIAEILNYNKPTDAINYNVCETDKCNWSDIRSNVNGQWSGGNVTSSPSDVDTSSWHPSTIFINESGLYQLMLRSKKPEAVKFRKWVTSEVLPSLRKLGTYSMPSSSLSSVSTPMDTTASIDFKTQLLQMENQMLKANHESQMKLMKSENELALLKFEKELALSKHENEIERLKSVVYKNIVEMAKYAHLASDNIAQNDLYRETLASVRPRIAAQTSQRNSECVI